MNHDEDIKKIHINSKKYPPLLKQINKPPEKLYIKGNLPDWDKYKIITIVGSRKNSEYGKIVCEHIISGLKNYKVIIVSGLAYGIDAIAHKTAIENNIKTIAIPGSGIHSSVLYPKANKKLAKNIVKNNGTILSEFDPLMKASKSSFPIRNRIMAGISHATVIIEAEKKSGTLITAKFATDFNRDVFSVPHDIFRKTSEGANMYIKMGAYPITSYKDLVEILKIEKNTNNKTKNDIKKYMNLNYIEEKIIRIIQEKPTKKEELISKLNRSANEILINLTNLELRKIIKKENDLYFLTDKR